MATTISIYVQPHMHQRDIDRDTPHHAASKIARNSRTSIQKLSANCPANMQAVTRNHHPHARKMEPLADDRRSCKKHGFAEPRTYTVSPLTEKPRTDTFRRARALLSLPQNGYLAGPVDRSRDSHSDTVNDGRFKTCQSLRAGDSERINSRCMHGSLLSRISG